MTPNDDFGRFFLPGPTEVHSDVLDEMGRPMIGHRGPGMRDLLESVDQPLRLLLATSPVSR